MEKDIKYGGYSATPGDYRGAEGELATAMNVVLEDGALKGIGAPKVLMRVGTDADVVYVHVSTDMVHYIVAREETDGDGNTVTGLYYCVMGGEQTPVGSDGSHRLLWTDDGGVVHSDKLVKVSSIGYTLIVVTDNEMRWYLWKDEAYRYLGNHIPFLPISFGLHGNLRFRSECSEEIDEKDRDGYKYKKVEWNIADSMKEVRTFSEENQSKVTSQVMATVNKFLKEQSIDKGCFSLPFLVRYAIRLYDGSLTHHSAPILMLPSTEKGVTLFCEIVNGEGNYKNLYLTNEGYRPENAEVDCMLMSCKLDYLCLDANNVKSQLSEWSDIVSSVDIFISQPIYTWKQGGTITGMEFLSSEESYGQFIGKADFEGVSEGRKDGHIRLPLTLNGTSVTTSNWSAYKSKLSNYQTWNITTLYYLNRLQYEQAYNGEHLLPAIFKLEDSDKSLQEQVKDVQNFYLLASIPIDELAWTTRTDVEVEDDYLQSLVAREVMTDDYLTNETVNASCLHTFNQRINLAGVKRTLFDGYPADCLWSYNSPNYNTLSIVEAESNAMRHNKVLTTKTDTPGKVTIAVTMTENGNTYVTQSTSILQLAQLYYGSGSYYTRGLAWGTWFYYPTTHATKMTIKNNDTCFSVNLKGHEFLNGSVAFEGIEVERAKGAVSLPSVTDKVVSMTNKIYTSEVNNPFYFPLSGINTVGTGTIIGISTATKALSQGQFGQFPMYVFATDGVWAMQVTSEGTYSAKQPVTRDVVIQREDGTYNADSITQIDTAVLFATDRGIMMLEGSSTACLTDILTDTGGVFDITTLPYHDTLLETSSLTEAQTSLIAFKEYIRECRMIYDYKQQRIVVYNPSQSYAYVYSLKDKTWGMMQSALQTNVDYYPNAYAMVSGGDMVDMSDEVTESGMRCLLVTRPFVLGAPDVLKTVNTVMQRGMIRQGHVQQILYGSRDLFNWYVVGSSTTSVIANMHGTPYKYFRLALIVSMEADERLWGCSVEYVTRFTNRLR